MASKGETGRIRVGIGGWSYEPWRETFYPDDLPKKSELSYASRQVTAIEINSTFYRLQTPEVYAKWRDQTPDDFVFTIKAPRHISHQRELERTAKAIERFVNSGLTELGTKLGPIMWQLSPTHGFHSDEIEKFFQFLPRTLGILPLRHALEIRHGSFLCSEYVALARRYGIATVLTQSPEYPCVTDVTGDFVYLRLRQAVASEPKGYSLPALRTWAERAKAWASGGEPSDLPKLTENPATPAPRNVFVFFINGAKERAPAAARGLLAML